jgi:hypothetical protein
MIEINIPTLKIRIFPDFLKTYIVILDPLNLKYTTLENYYQHQELYNQEYNLQERQSLSLVVRLIDLYEPDSKPLLEELNYAIRIASLGTSIGNIKRIRYLDLVNRPVEFILKVEQ